MTSATMVHEGEGEVLWMLNTLMTVKATGSDTAGAFSLLEQVVTSEGNPPVHLHTDHEEAFYLLDGEIDVWVGDDRVRCAKGAFSVVPRGTPHTYAVRSRQARLLVIGTPAGLDEFFVEVGEPALAPTLPVPTEPDAARVAEVGARHGVVIVGPPPA